MRTPFFGPAYVARSKNLADERLINLYPELAEGSAKDVGAFYMTPGLVRLASFGPGPIRGAIVSLGYLWLVSGNQIWQVAPDYSGTQIGTLPSSSGPVQWIANGTQVVVFDGQVGVLGPQAYPLTGGSIGAAGLNYTVGDVITLAPTGGGQIATATVQVTGIGAGGSVTGFEFVSWGSFAYTQVSTFTQGSTTGSGAGFTLVSASYGATAELFILALPFSGPLTATYQDGFGLVNAANSGEWFQSDLFDLSVWGALNFATKESQPDPIASMQTLYDEVWLLGHRTTEIWINAGTPYFAFQKLSSVFIEAGCAAPWSPAILGQSMVWLSQNEQGQGSVVMVSGYAPQRISTHAMEHEIAQYPMIGDAIGFAYQQEGHTFYVLTFPSGNATWVFDATTSAQARQPMWHKRAALLNGQWNRWWPNCAVQFGGETVVGDGLSGNLYRLDLDAATDNGTARKWLRSWRALPKPTDQPITFRSLRIDMQTGVGIPDGTDPAVTLRWSDDGGHTWSAPRVAQIGGPGATAQRVKFNALGSTRRNSGLDRIFELASADAFPVALVGAELEAD